MGEERNEPDASELPSTELDPLSARDLDRIGPYRLLQKLGEGGMGEVWEAEQEEPVRRRVALKLIKPGMDTKQVVARFESERQALALMSHASIAKVFDAGATEQGRPYFAMEYVRGEPLTQYCDRHRLSTMERLELFLQVCDGVQHAHQKGIIHRDLKPSNVLVEVSDGKPVPKIIDFGVAKATQQRLTETTMFTQLGVMVGTPAYMSPEQAEMTGLDVDTRTDVYSLGVMLYELLVGALPFDPKELKAAGYDEIRRKIREEEPSRPSARITAPGGDSTEAAKRRNVDLPTLRRELSGDLDWITMKALAKDRTRRYGSPNELAADIGRHLRNEPVDAGPPSTTYRMGKFVRRHRLGVAAGAVVLLALVLGLAAATYGMVRATRAEAQARQEAATAEQVSEFLVSLFEVSDPNEARGREIKAREILDRGAEKISRELKDQPLVRARLLHTMGQVYFSLALHDQARPHLEEALAIHRSHLGDDDPTVANSLMALGLECFSTSDYEAALAHFREALRIREHNFEPHDAAIAESLADIARTLSLTGKIDQLPALLGRVLDINETALGPNNTGERSSLTWIPFHKIPFPGARSLLERDVALRERALGPDHPLTLPSVLALGKYIANEGDLEAGRALMERALASMEETYGDWHPKTNMARAALAETLTALGDFEAAYPLYQGYLAHVEETYGTNSRAVGETLLALSVYFSASGDLAEAISHLERAVPILEKTGGHQAMLAQALSRLGFALFRAGEAERARPLLERAVTVSEEVYGPNHLATEESLAWLGTVSLMSGDPEGAVPVLERCVEIRRVLYGQDHPLVQQGITFLADALTLSGDHESARPMYRDAIEKLEAAIASDNIQLAQPLMGLGRIYLLEDRQVEGRALFERGVSIVAGTLGENHPEVEYQRACYHALAGERSEALQYLRRASDAGSLGLKDRLAWDPDFASLHGDPAFEALLSELESRSEAPIPP